MYVDRDENGRIVALYANPQREGHEFVEGAEIHEPEPTYADLRRAEYPPIYDLIDGLVKNDTEQIEAYRAACMAVKAKYPKP